MKKSFKTLFKVISAIIIIFLIVSVLITLFVDINQYKKQITQIVEQQAGLKLEIDGELTLSIFSGLKFHASDVKLLLDKELIADIESVSLGMTAYSLYLGEPRITSVDLALRTLKFSRNKKGQLNFLPLYYTSPASDDAAKNVAEIDEKLPLKSLAINDIELSIDDFQYRDELSAITIKLTDSEASLSNLPIIDHHELVIADPAILVDYDYDGELVIKKALINQYQILNLDMQFTDKKGDFTAEKTAFSFIEGNKNHALPPMLFDAQGQFKLELRYASAAPVWAQPERLKIYDFDFNLARFELSDKHFQLKTEQSHLVIDALSIYEAKRYLLNEFTIKSLSANTRKVDLRLIDGTKNTDSYNFDRVNLQLKHVPVIHKAKPLEPLSDDFINKFATKGIIKLSSNRLKYKSQEVENINISLIGSKDKIKLLLSSSNVLNSSLKADGHIKVKPSKGATTSQWQLTLLSDKLNLKTISELLNSPYVIEGFSSINTHLSGQYHQSSFKITHAKVDTKAINLLLHGLDLNKVLNEFQNSQSVGMLDVGAVVLLGPAGVLLTKGNDYNNLINSVGNEGNSKINQLNLNLTLADDIVTMDDVAFSTTQHRLAVKGKINLKEKKFATFKVATIDKKGCPIYEEEVQGTLADPQVKKVNILVKGIVNPINTLVKKISKPINGQCKKPFYTGLVKAPGQ